MKHTSPFALGMISYNTLAYLEGVLQDLQARGVLLHWWHIQHPAYNDRITGLDRKAHRHVELLVNGGFDSDDIAKEFWEQDPNNVEPFKPQYEDKERHIPISLQLEHALMYDLHERKYILLNTSIGEKPYYDLEYNTIATDNQDWLNMILLDCGKDFWLKLVQKPSKEAIFKAIYNNEPICEGDKPLTLALAMNRHWLDSWSFRNVAGALKDRGINVDDFRTE